MYDQTLLPAYHHNKLEMKELLYIEEDLDTILKNQDIGGKEFFFCQIKVFCQENQI